MSEAPGQIKDTLAFGSLYRLLVEVKGWLGSPTVRLGTSARCRYCGNTCSADFHNIAHTFPEALGNKWVVSLDECDNCNLAFGTYDDALTKAVSPFLTLGGVKGKGGKIRTSGRTGGRSQISRTETADIDRISVTLNGFEPGELIGVDPLSGTLRFKTPLPATPFKPRHAYKALCKIAFALLPEGELRHFEKMRRWLLDIDDQVDFPVLRVGMSFARVGAVYPFLQGALFQRVDPAGAVPHILLLAMIGPVCFQIDLMPDHLDDHIEVGRGLFNLRAAATIADGSGANYVKIDYGEPTFLDWVSNIAEPQPIETMLFEFNPATTVGKLTPVFR